MAKKYWQIAVGSDGRDYAADFLRFGLAFVGGEKQIEIMMRDIEVGDIVVARRGMTEIVAAGTVVQRGEKHVGNGDKLWLRDYDGWDLSAYCHVDWHVPPAPIKTKGLTRATIQRLHQPDLISLADGVLTGSRALQSYDHEPDCAPLKKVTDKQILEFLVYEGLRPSDAEELTATFNRVRLLARYYYDSGRWPDVREHETRTFLVIPLLLALGWSEQQIKIELPIQGKGRADIGCFSRPYMRDGSACKLIIETKGFSQGLSFAPDQARGYAAELPDCVCVVVTNGYCYKTYRKSAKGFSLDPSAYLNLLDPRDKYPLAPERVEGCLEVLRMLLPTHYYF